MEGTVHCPFLCRRNPTVLVLSYVKQRYHSPEVLFSTFKMHVSRRLVCGWPRVAKSFKGSAVPYLTTNSRLIRTCAWVMLCVYLQVCVYLYVHPFKRGSDWSCMAHSSSLSLSSILHDIHFCVQFIIPLRVKRIAGTKGNKWERPENWWGKIFHCQWLCKTNNSTLSHCSHLSRHWFTRFLSDAPVHALSHTFVSQFVFALRIIKCVYVSSSICKCVKICQCWTMCPYRQ